MQSGEPGPVAVEQLVTATMPGIAVDRDPRTAQRVDVPVHSPDRHAQLLSELLGRQPPPVLQQEDEGHKSGRTHGLIIPGPSPGLIRASDPIGVPE